MEIKLEHSDARGEIYSIQLPDDQELMLFHCKKGYMRGGHSHDAREMVMLLSGRMRYYKVGAFAETVVELKPGDVSYNQPGEAHMGEFLEDSWLVEAKLGTKNGDWSTTDYEPYRQLVRSRLES